MSLTDRDLLYAATARCEACLAGVAYPLDTSEALKRAAWVCSNVIRGVHPPEGHAVLPFAFWKVREETSVNNEGGQTTRPAGTIARTVGRATCGECSHTWQSEPYDAPHARSHWRSGPCPACGNALGGDGSWSSSDAGKPIDVRFRDVVLNVVHVATVELVSPEDPPEAA